MKDSPFKSWNFDYTKNISSSIVSCTNRDTSPQDLSILILHPTNLFFSQKLKIFLLIENKQLLYPQLVFVYFDSKTKIRFEVVRLINTATSLSLVWPYSMFCFADQWLSSPNTFDWGLCIKECAWPMMKMAFENYKISINLVFQKNKFVSSFCTF